MLTLLDDQYAPITSSIGFLECPISIASQALADWRGALYGPKRVTITRITDPFPSVLRWLEPLTGGTPPRELVLTTDSPWTAYFDCFVQGPEATSTISHLAELIRCRGVTVRNIRHTAAKGRRGRIGSVQLQLFGADKTAFLNYVRTIEATHDGRRWLFFQSGTPQAFEHPRRYTARSITDRFPPDLLDEYCRALGIRYFDPTFYQADATLIESSVPIGPGAYVMSLTETQKWLGLVSPSGP